MADVNGNSPDVSEDALVGSAARVLENLAELEPELVAAGIFDQERKPVSISSGSEHWTNEAAKLLDALEASSGPEKFDSAHIAMADGEVFAVSESGYSLLAVTGRFVLASLTSYDMRMALRDVARSGTGRKSPEPAPEAGKRGAEDA